MQIILIKDVDNLGAVNELVEVRPAVLDRRDDGRFADVVAVADFGIGGRRERAPV